MSEKISRELRMTQHLLTARRSLREMLKPGADAALSPQQLLNAGAALEAAVALLRESAPKMWQVEDELGQIAAFSGREAVVWCPLPVEFERVPAFSAKVGLPLVMRETPGYQGEPPALTLGGEPLDVQTLRDALIELVATVRSMPVAVCYGAGRSGGHRLYGPNSITPTAGWLVRAGFLATPEAEVPTNRPIDPGYCPGVDDAVKSFRRSRPEVEGEARLTHENGMTILGIWDRTFDDRPASHSTYIAIGSYDFPMMCKLCERHFPERWHLQRERGITVKLVEKTLIPEMR